MIAGKRFRQIYKSPNSQRMEHYFKGKTVLVTGAGWGIGAATALLYAAYGAKVIVSDTSQKGGKEILAKIKTQKGNAIYIKADVSSQAACEELIKTTVQAYSSIDIACNNSAVFCETLPSAGGEMKSSANLAALNLTSLNNCMQYEIEAMQKQRGGVIINTLSIMGKIGEASSTQYIEAKYGTERLQDTIGGKHKLFPTDMHGTIQEVARHILWLSSDESLPFSNVFNDNN
jgi:NAD(P)-dependent dehydrogenase (short-subunit alcohol dehydrogenase family)